MILINANSVSFSRHIQFQLISESYLQEAEWCHQDYIPSFNDHVNVSTISAGIQLLTVGLLVGMGDVATKEVFEWAIGSNNDAIRLPVLFNLYIHPLKGIFHPSHHKIYSFLTLIHSLYHNLSTVGSLVTLSKYIHVRYSFEGFIETNLMVQS
jgi:fumarate reductase subunit D